MKKLLLLIVLLLQWQGHAQRWYGINDSTSYSFQDVNLIAGKHKLYLNQNNSLSVIKDFTDAEEPNNYIRDFDFIDAQTWYVVVGLRYIGGDTKLYKTTDAGLNWEIISPESFTVTGLIDGKASSINQMQYTNGRIYLFDAYYFSRVFYSDDLGQTWVLWFESIWSHYYQMYTCGDDLYLQGMPGDGFSAYLFKIPESFYGQENMYAGNAGNCVNGNGDCHYAHNLTYPGFCAYFDNLFETEICPQLMTETTNFNAVELSPNPTSNTVKLDRINAKLPFEITVYNELGQLLSNQINATELDFSTYQSGIYVVKISQNNQQFIRKVLKK